jgi:RHS repeat-associated protein
VAVELIASLIRSLDDNSGLCYYGARYLAPWLARWISPDSAGAVDDLNLYVYVDNNPLKYRDPTGHFPLISWDSFVNSLIRSLPVVFAAFAEDVGTNV